MPQFYDELMRLALRKGAQATTAIKGNALNDEEIAKLQEGQKLPPSKEYQELEVENILDAFNELLVETVYDNKAERIISESYIEILTQFSAKTREKAYPIPDFNTIEKLTFICYLITFLRFSHGLTVGNSVALFPIRYRVHHQPSKLRLYGACLTAQRVVKFILFPFRRVIEDIFRNILVRLFIANDMFVIISLP